MYAATVTGGRGTHSRLLRLLALATTMVLLQKFSFTRNPTIEKGARP